MIKKPPVKKVPKLTIDVPMDNNNIWHVRVVSIGKTWEEPYRLDTLERRFALQDKDWNVTVLGKWINGDSQQFVKINT
jgi:hypothetical protein